MTVERRRQTLGAEGRGLRWGLIFVALFGYSLCLTNQRIELRERNSRIEGLEHELQQLRSDEAILRVRIDRACSFAEVQRIAGDKWKMDVARPEQRILLAVGEKPRIDAPVPDDRAFLADVAERLSRIVRGDVAEARPADLGGSDDAPAE